MRPWTPQRVLDAAIVMEWRPDGASEVLTDGYRLIRYPDWALDPSFPAAQVTRSRLSRPADAVIDEVLARVRQWGLLGVAWWVSDGPGPRTPRTGCEPGAANASTRCRSWPVT